MSLLSALSIICGLMLHVSCSALNNRYCVPRKTVPYQNELKLFREEGISNYSTMLMRDELGVLLLGAREAIYALDINNISDRKSAVYWRVTEEKQMECTYKGKHAEVECRNYIRTLHRVNDTAMYVCGTNAFSPTCDYMTFANGQLRLLGKQEEGKGKCPFDPFQRYSSLMVGNDLYSATSINFLGSEPVVLRSSNLALRTEFKSSWLSEPNFVYMDFVGESFDSPDGDDDKVYLFFSENAMEYDFYSKVAVSRVARVCKEDMGGQRTLQRKWTSFLKARLDCSLPEPSLPPIVQDVFLLKHEDWRKSVFYAVFTPQSSLSQVSAVCAYSMYAIRDTFNEGKFKTPVAVETSHVKWVMYTGEVPVPRPGACINNVARKMGMNRSLDLPDKTLQFIRDRPLMDEAVQPLTGGPLLVKRGALLTRIVVDRVLALDGQRYAVMFIGTENGYVQKSVNYDGEMFIIEEIQLYENPEPISILRLSSSKGQLYAGSQFGAIQMPVSNCSRYNTCVDCILARDPYCAWDFSTEQCSSVSSLSPSSNTAMQSLKEGDISQCPQPEPVAAVDVTLVPENNIQLPCQLHSNLAQVLWRLSNQTLHSNHKYYIYSGGLLILSASESDAGLYTCDSVEQMNGRTYNRTVAVYRLQLYFGPAVEESTTPGNEVSNSSGSVHTLNTVAPGMGPNEGNEDPLHPETQIDSGKVTRLEVAVALLSLLCLSLMGVIFWIWSRGRWDKKAKGEDAEVDPEESPLYQEPPKFEDEEEFPGLTSLTVTDRLISSSNAAKLCNEENQREGGQHQSADQNKEKSTATKTLPTETVKKGQKAEKVQSSKKSKVPVQLDIGNMLAALEKKQQSQKAKQDAKPVILSVGGGLPVVQKQPSVQKKPPWQQDKIAHNPLDSTSPLVKKGKQREVPKAKKPTPLKKVILKEREERKQRRLLEERGLLPENELNPASDPAEEEQCDTNAPEVGSPTEELDDQLELNGINQMVREGDEETDKDETVEQQTTTSPVPCPVNRPKIHSRKFRDYCSQMLSRDVDECVTTLLKELVRFQDRLYQKDPMKARMKRRIVMGLREVLKHLKLRKVKCVIISPNCERIQSKGGLDEALHTIIDTCREQGVPFVFALSRKALGRCVNKAVPVSLVGIFNYDGAQDYYHKMIELSSEARRAYEVMVSSLEQTGQAEAEAEAEAEQGVNTEEELQISRLAEPSPDTTQPEEPEYIKIWKKMLEKDYNHKFLNFEEQLSSMHLDSECTENTDEDVKS